MSNIISIEALAILNERFGCDSLIALGTVDGTTPHVRAVNSYYENGAFYVVAFCYPVVPKGRDRIRTQLSTGHTKDDIDFAVKCFGEVKKEMGI